MHALLMLQDLKDRFYFVQKTLIEVRNLVTEVTPENILFSRPYDKGASVIMGGAYRVAEYELSRKAHLERCFSRPSREEEVRLCPTAIEADHEQEEDRLLQEARLLQLELKKKEVLRINVAAGPLTRRQKQLRKTVHEKTEEERLGATVAPATSDHVDPISAAVASSLQLTPPYRTRVGHSHIAVAVDEPATAGPVRWLPCQLGAARARHR